MNHDLTPIHEPCLSSVKREEENICFHTVKLEHSLEIYIAIVKKCFLCLQQNMYIYVHPRGSQCYRLLYYKIKQHLYKSMHQLKNTTGVQYVK